MQRILSIAVSLLVAMIFVQTTGCTVDHKPLVQARAQQYLTLFFQEDYQGCAKMLSPATIDRIGSEGAVARLKLAAAFVKLGQIGEGDYRIDDIQVGPENKTATVTVSVNVNKDWKALPAQNWVFEQGSWYLTM